MAEGLGSVSPEEADRIATEHFVQQRFGEAYRVARVAELPELKKFYYQARWNLARERTDDDGTPLGRGGFFVSLSTGEVEDIGSGAFIYASIYLHTRDQLPPDVEPSVQELAALLARHSSEQLIAMCREVEWRREGSP